MSFSVSGRPKREASKKLQDIFKLEADSDDDDFGRFVADLDVDDDDDLSDFVADPGNQNFADKVLPILLFRKPTMGSQCHVFRAV